MDDVLVRLTGRQLAILSAMCSRCIGWDVPGELQRFVNVAGEFVRGGFSEAEMEGVLEHLASAWQEQKTQAESNRLAMDRADRFSWPK